MAGRADRGAAAAVVGEAVVVRHAGDGGHAGVQPRQRHVRAAADVAAGVAVGADQRDRVRPVVRGIRQVTARDAGLGRLVVVRGELRRHGDVRRPVHVPGLRARGRARPMAVVAVARDVRGVVDVLRVLRAAALVRRRVAALAEGLGAAAAWQSAQESATVPLRPSFHSSLSASWQLLALVQLTVAYPETE